MSDYERHTGTLERIHFSGSIDKFGKEIVGVELDEFYDNWSDFFKDNYDKYGYFIYKDLIYKIHDEEHDPSSDIFDYKIVDNKIEYQFSFYNGGTDLTEQIEVLLDILEESIEENDDLQFKEDVESVSYSDDFWYALTNGYINLDILEDNEAKKKLIEAISVVEDFQYQLESQDFFEEM